MDIKKIVKELAAAFTALLLAMFIAAILPTHPIISFGIGAGVAAFVVWLLLAVMRNLQEPEYYNN
jgi:hypothetical protein